MANFGGKEDKGGRSGKKFGLQFSGWRELTWKLDELSSYGLMEGVKKALVETHKVVTPKLEAEIKKHKRTGATEQSLVREPHINVEGTLVSVDIGFDLDKGGLPSLWLMHGTPRQKPDKALYEALYGVKTSAVVRSVQRKAIKETIDKYMAKKGG